MTGRSPVFFAPDIRFAGYLTEPNFGVVAYNLVQVYGFGIVFLAVDAGLSAPVVAALGALWADQSSFDRKR